MKGGAITTEEYAVLLEKLKDKFSDAGAAAGGFGNDLLSEIEEIQDAVDELSKSSESISRDFLTSFLDIARGTATVKDAFKSLANDIIDELYRVLVGSAEAGTGLSGFLSKGINAITGSIFGGGSSFPNTPPPSVLARAHGGPVYQGQDYLVGEQGREIFRPDQSGMIIPNNRISSSRSGQQGQAAQVNQTVNISAFSDGDIDRVLVKRMPQLQQLILAALLKQQSVGAI